MTNNENKDKEIGSFYMGRQRPPEQPERVLPKGGLTIVAVLAFAAVVWYAYPHGGNKDGNADVPVIMADKEAYKFTPDDPGGMDVPHQDSTVFEPLEKGADQASSGKVENLIAKTEQPVDKDAVLGDAPAAAATPAPAQAVPADLKVEEVAPGAEKFTAKEEAAAPKAAETPAKAAAAEKPAAPKTPAAAAKPASAKTTVKAEAAKAATAVANGVYIQLGSYRDAAGAAADWKKFQQKHPTLLGALSMRTQKVDLGSKGVFNRLQAGALPEAKAKDVCTQLKSAGVPNCIVVH
jgi:hypothetical protein